jgi:hypothetical protein
MNNTHWQCVQLLTNQHKKPVQRCTQYISLIAGTSDDSTGSPNVSKYNEIVIPVHENLMTFQTQGLNRPPHENARTYPETHQSSHKDGIELPPAPRPPIIALPKQEDDEDFSDVGSELGLGGGPALSIMKHEPEPMLGCLDDIFPGLLGIEKLRSGELD